MITDQRLILLLMNEVEPLYVLTARDVLTSPRKGRNNLEILLIIRDEQHPGFVAQNKPNILMTRIYDEMKEAIDNMVFTVPPEVRIYHQTMNVFANEISRLHLHPWKETTNRSAQLIWNFGTIIYPSAISRDDIVKACCDYSEEVAGD